MSDQTKWTEMVFRQMMNKMSVEDFNKALKEADMTVQLQMAAVRMGCI